MTPTLLHPQDLRSSFRGAQSVKKWREERAKTHVVHTGPVIPDALWFSCRTRILGPIPSLEEGLAIDAVVPAGTNQTVKGTQRKGQKEGQGKVE